MIFGSDRKQLRKIYFDAWQKHQLQSQLTDLEVQIVNIIAMHPQFHQIINGDPEKQLDKDFANIYGDENPFLHMGLHLGLREQLSTNRPAGIKNLFRDLLAQYIDSHELEHLCMEILAECLWEAQRNQQTPDEKNYLRRLQHLKQ